MCAVEEHTWTDVSISMYGDTIKQLETNKYRNSMKKTPPVLSPLSKCQTAPGNPVGSNSCGCSSYQVLP